VVIVIGLVTIFVRGDWQKARGFDKLILLGPVFYAAPLAAFGTEHLTLTKGIASMHFQRASIHTSPLALPSGVTT
jgi:hypothetical protein